MNNLAAALIALGGLASYTRLVETGNHGGAGGAAVIALVLAMAMIGQRNQPPKPPTQTP